MPRSQKLPPVAKKPTPAQRLKEERANDYLKKQEPLSPTGRRNENKAEVAEKRMTQAERNARQKAKVTGKSQKTR